VRGGYRLRMQTRVGRAVSVIVGLLLVAVAVTALVAPRQPFTQYRQPVVIAAAAAFLLVGLLWRPPAPLRRVLRTRWMPWLVAVAGGALAIVAGISLRFPWSWDVGITFRLAARLHTGMPLTETQVVYLSRYPNTHPLIGVHRVAYAVAESTGLRVETVVVGFVGVAAGLTVLLVHPLVAPVAGRVRAVAAQLVVVGLVVTSPWMAVPYTDVLAMPLLTGAVVLVLRAARRRDWLAAFQLLGSAALTAGAVVVKTTPAVFIVAVAVVGVLLAIDLRVRWRDSLVAVMGTVVWVGVTLALVSTFTATATSALGPGAVAAVRPDRAPPVMWWLANGMTETQRPSGTPLYGAYNAAMVRGITNMDSTQATAWSRDWIRDQWENRGAADVALFYANKAAWNWGDGMFWAWGEGRDATLVTQPPKDGVRGLVNDVNGPFGRWYPLHSDLAQGLWVALLLVTGLGALRARAPSRDVLLVGLTVLGIAVFTLLFQGRSRYLLTFVPLVAAWGAMVRQRPARWPALTRRVGRSSRSAAAPL
jgi:hypothetical protein